MNTLYLVPLPQGDPDDISMRALRILGEVQAIAADDIGAASTPLDGYGISTLLVGYSEALDALTRGDVALISTRGTPGIGTGQEIVQWAIGRGVQVVPLPGADAAITALVLSGLPTDAFVYVETPPDDLSRYATERATMIFVTNDVTEALMQIMAAFGDRRICVAARLTQTNESIYRGTLREALEYDRTQTVPYEIMLVVEGAPEQAAEVWDEIRVELALRELLKSGEPLKLAAKKVASASGWDRRTVYKLGVEVKKLFD